MASKRNLRYHGNRRAVIASGTVSSSAKGGYIVTMWRHHIDKSMLEHEANKACRAADSRVLQIKSLARQQRVDDGAVKLRARVEALRPSVGEQQ